MYGIDKPRFVLQNLKKWEILATNLNYEIKSVFKNGG